MSEELAVGDLKEMSREELTDHFGSLSHEQALSLFEDYLRDNFGKTTGDRNRDGHVDEGERAKIENRIEKIRPQNQRLSNRAMATNIDALNMAARTGRDVTRRVREKAEAQAANKSQNIEGVETNNIFNGDAPLPAGVEIGIDGGRVDDFTRAFATLNMMFQENGESIGVTERLKNRLDLNGDGKIFGTDLGEISTIRDIVDAAKVRTGNGQIGFCSTPLLSKVLDAETGLEGSVLDAIRDRVEDVLDNTTVENPCMPTIK